MIHSFSQKHIKHFYDWQNQFNGHKINDSPVGIAPVFAPFYHLPLGNPTQPDDGRLPTVLETAGKYTKRFLSWISEKNDQGNKIASPPSIIAGTIAQTTFSVFLPNEPKIKIEAMLQFFAMLAPSKLPVSFEIITTTTIQLQFTCAESDKHHLSSQLKGYFPTCIIQERGDLLQKLISDQAEISVVDLGLKEEFIRPLKMVNGNEIDPFVGIFSILEQVQPHEIAAIQLLFKHSNHPWADSITRSVTNSIGQEFFFHEPQMQVSAKQKISSDLYGCIIRIVGGSNTKQRSIQISSHLAQTVSQVSSSNVNSLITLPNEDYPDDVHLKDLIERTSHRSPMVLNSNELLTLVHFPSTTITCSKFINTVKKTKSLPAICEGHPFIVGANEHNGVIKPVSLSGSQRTRHLVLTGGSGVGKSNLLASLILECCRLNHGAAVLDPHGALIDSVLKYIPEHRMKDVILCDPSDKEFPMGINILEAHSDIEKEVLSSDLVSNFRKHSLSWGDSLGAQFQNGVDAFLYSKKGGTLHDLRKFLIDKDYRNSFFQTVEEPNIVFYWQKEFPLMRAGSIAAILNRLDGFLRPKVIRNMIAQSSGLDFEDILENKKILLVKLSHGLLGAENSYLLGSLLSTKIYQAALARQAKEERHDFSFFLDEFHHFMTPSLIDILSGARKYGLGLILAHQSISQVDNAINDSILANANTRICFRLSLNDAQKMADSFTYFTPHDFQNLATGEAIMKVDKPEYSFNLQTNLVSGKEHSKETIDAIIQHSRDTYCTPREEIEKMLFENSPVYQTQQEKKKEYPTKAFPEKEVNIDLPKKDIGIAEPPVVSSTNESKEEATKKSLVKKQETTLHRYIQNLIKKIAEAKKGYKATLEAPTPDNKGKVDVLLEKDNHTIACEVSVTTDLTWEIHNIQKCLAAPYDQVLVCMAQRKSVDAMKEKILELFDPSERTKIEVIESENLYAYFEQLTMENPITETTQKGYKVKVEYDSPEQKDMNKKRIDVGKVILNSLNKMKK